MRAHFGMPFYGVDSLRFSERLQRLPSKHVRLPMRRSVVGDSHAMLLVPDLVVGNVSTVGAQQE